MFWSKEEKKYDLLKLRENWTFTLFKTQWQIQEVAEYYWKMDGTSVEYTIISNEKTAYLEVELFKGEYEVVYSEEIDIDEDYLAEALETEEIEINQKIYYLDETYSGSYKNKTTRSYREGLECFIFYASDDEQITIERWDDDSLEAFIGKEIKAKKIKNIKES